MTWIRNLVIVILVAVSCSNSVQSDDVMEGSFKSDTALSVRSHTYDSTTIPLFFKSLVANHIEDYNRIDSLNFLSFGSITEVSIKDSANRTSYYTIKILHDLLTSQSAYDGSKGKILNIPYLWHWINPNPRHEIRFVKNGKLLKDSKSPKEFRNYKSYADIDRTPYLYLSELFEDKPKYYSESCDTFSTFGWCSEREMAFVCLVEILGYEGKVVVKGNHSWSEFIIPMKMKSGTTNNFLVKVDNTFDNVEWTQIENSSLVKWRQEMGSGKLSKWYNTKSHSLKEKKSINEFMISSKAMLRIEIKLVIYLNSMIN